MRLLELIPPHSQSAVILADWSRPLGMTQIAPACVHAGQLLSVESSITTNITSSNSSSTDDGNTDGAAVEIRGGCCGGCETRLAVFSPCQPAAAPPAVDDFPDGLWGESGGRDYRTEVP